MQLKEKEKEILLLEVLLENLYLEELMLGVKNR
jgi:hypothetical protein